MRTIRLIALTTLLLVGGCGLASYFITVNFTDPTSSSTLLFVLAWVFSGFGVTGAAVTIAGCLTMDSYGERDFLQDLFWVFVGVTVVAGVLLAIVTGLICSSVGKPGAADGSTVFDAGRFVSVYVAAMGGYILGFFILLGIHARESWIGEVDEEKPARLRRVS